MARVFSTCFFTAVTVSVMVAVASTVVIAQKASWAVAAGSTGTTAVYPVFVDEQYIVMQEGEEAFGTSSLPTTVTTPSANASQQRLQLYLVNTHAAAWPAPIVACASTSNFTVIGQPVAYHFQRTGNHSLTYMCWVAGSRDGSIVTVDLMRGEVVRATHVRSGALKQPAGLWTLGSRASGAYCVSATLDAICVSSSGVVWRLGRPSFSSTPSAGQVVWLHEYNGTLVLQHVWATVPSFQLFDTWTGELIKTLPLPTKTFEAVLAGDRFLVAMALLHQPVTLQVLDMESGVLSATVSLPGSDAQSDSGEGASPAAQLVGDDFKPELVVTLPNSELTTLVGWKLPALATTPTHGKQLFSTPLQSTSTIVNAESWAVSPGFVVFDQLITDSSGFETVRTRIVSLHSGTIVANVTRRNAPMTLTSVTEKDDIVIITGQSNHWEGAPGTAITVLNATNGQPIWTKEGVEIVGPELSPIDTSQSPPCLMVAPTTGWGSGPWNTVECLVL